METQAFEAVQRATDTTAGARVRRRVSDDDLEATFLTQPLIEYFLKKLPDRDEDTLRAQACELLKYLILVRFSPGRILFGKDIDDLWHYWILQTREYEQLCAALPGGSFRHHSSNDYVAGEGVAEAPLADGIRRILSFFISYHANFGPVKADRVACWPPLQMAMEELGWDLHRFNAFLEARCPEADRVGQATLQQVDLQ